MNPLLFIMALQLAVCEGERPIGCLSLPKDRLRQDKHPPPSEVTIQNAGSATWNMVATFIERIYTEVYGARVNVHYPALMSVNDLEGQVLSALGYRYADQEVLFLEQYTGIPIEQCLQVPRSRIVEMGNLASIGGGASWYLMMAMAAYLAKRGFTHAVVTGTAQLELRLRRLGLQPVRVCRADPNCLLQKNEHWGTYYDTEPHVLSGRIDVGCQVLQRVWGIEFQAYRPGWPPQFNYRKEWVHERIV